MRAVIHVDMDAFFASVEQLDDPSIRGKPVVVGARSSRGVVAAASYGVRKYGVRSAMPMVEALRRCPDAIVVPPRRARYVELSRAVFAIFRRYTPVVEGLSVDEAFLDVTGSQALFGSGAEIARSIRRDIYGDLRLTASAGVAPSKFVAKIASDLDKPNGLVVVPAGEEAAFLAPLDLKRMWRVGPKAQKRLRGAGVQTIGDLARLPEETLTALLGSWGLTVAQLARGIDDRPVVTGRPPKSLGSEETFERDLRTKEELLKPILSQCIRVADRLVKKGLFADVVTLKLKYGDHQIRTRQLKLEEPSSSADAIFEATRTLIDRFDHLSLGVRLTGVSVSGLSSSPAPTLFTPEKRERQEKLAVVTGALRDRFGVEQITRASLISPSNGARKP